MSQRDGARGRAGGLADRLRLDAAPQVMTGDDPRLLAAMWAPLVIAQFEALLAGRDPDDIEVVRLPPPSKPSWEGVDLVRMFFPGIIMTPAGMFTDRGFTPRGPSNRRRHDNPGV